jgi:hypothetical protein
MRWLLRWTRLISRGSQLILQQELDRAAVLRWIFSLKIMKMTSRLLALVSVSLFLLVGCGKSNKVAPAAEINGVTVDMPKLQKAFEANTNPEVRNSVTQVAFGVRYGDYVKALTALDQLANNSNVSEAEKKVVNEVIEQVKKLAENAPAPAPAQ